MSFEPKEQDKWAINKLKSNGALKYINSGKIDQAFFISCNVWSSLPCYENDLNGYYNQPIKNIDSLLNKYEERLKLYI